MTDVVGAAVGAHGAAGAAVVRDEESVLAPPFPAVRAAAYRSAGCWGERTIGEELSASAALHAGRTAVVDAHGRLTYAELDAVTDRVGAGMLDAGLVPGDRVLFQVTNRLESVVAWYACQKAGLVPVATLAAHREHEMRAIGALSAARAYVVEITPAGTTDLVALARNVAGDVPSVGWILTIDPPGGPAPVTAAPAAEDAPLTLPLASLGAGLPADAVAAAVRSAQAARGPESIAALQLSGGTTGAPKLIPRRHNEYWYNALAYARHLGWTAETKVAHLIPIIHNAGIVCATHASHAVGATLVLGTPDARASLPLLAREGTTFALVGHAHFAAVGEPAFLDALPTLDGLLLSGTKVPDDLFEEIERRGIWSGQLFGMGEGLFCLSRRDDPREARLRSVGRVLSPLDEIRICYPGSEQQVAAGEIGELCCRGPYTIPGYYAAPERNTEAFTSDGFYRTGDLARWQDFDGEPHLLIEGRIKDVINRGGEKINAEEVELLLLSHPDVAEVAVVAMPDPRLGERPCAYVVSGRAFGVGDAQEWLAGLGVAKYKWPERVERLDVLPRTKVGKLNKALLRQMAADPGPGH
ncbi:AMP-binding protein [Kineosporia sp. R_H_3]|uniref:AMP-binding protein n=1 Tax=Kineosporia sp. R_H_3 TaxID=1961848 RepID=UPI000B4A8E2A|nr:AMP-binding protein [Kineosporia sp. R_H_3]